MSGRTDIKQDKHSGYSSQLEEAMLCVVGHNGEKLLFIDLAVLVQIKFVYHRLSVDS